MNVHPTKSPSSLRVKTAVRSTLMGQAALHPPSAYLTRSDEGYFSSDSEFSQTPKAIDVGAPGIRSTERHPVFPTQIAQPIVDFSVVYAHCLQQLGVNAKHCLQIRMGMSVGLLESQENLHMPAHQRLGLRPTVRGVEKMGYAGEA